MSSGHSKSAPPRAAPRLYLVTPEIEDADAFAPQLSAALAAADVAAVRLRFAEAGESTLVRRAKVLVRIVQQKDAAAILDDNTPPAALSGADGAHLTGIGAFEEAVETLKPDRIAGAGGLVTRHDAMLAAERGADYVLFGGADENGSTPAFETVIERVGWWAEVFQIPCVGLAAQEEEIAPLRAAGADFVALGDWIWNDPRGPAIVVAAASHLLAAEPVA
jgi:thiamine-phosphate pyrophosphorylase